MNPTRGCSVRTCEKPHHAHGMCGMHNRRNMVHGDPHYTPLVRTPQENFWRRVDKSGTCWLWTGYVDANGYGHVGQTKPNRPTPSQTKMVHRIAYELLVGTIPEGMHLDHLCRVTNCVNPDHLEPVTVRENVRRGIHGVLTTHCSEGHELSGRNVYVRPSDNSRRCVTCRNRYERDRRRGDEVLNGKNRKPCRRCGAEKSPGRYKHLCDRCIDATGVTKWHRLGR